MGKLVSSFCRRCRSAYGVWVFLFLGREFPSENYSPFPCPLPSFLPARLLGPGWAVGQAAGGEGIGQWRPSVPAHKLAAQPQFRLQSATAVLLNYQRRHGQAGLPVPSARLPAALCPHMPPGECPVPCELSSLTLQPGG